jgi:hypothetical protein
MSFSDELRLFAAGGDSAFADAESRRIAAEWLEHGKPDDMYAKLLRANVDHLRKKLTAASTVNQLLTPPPRLNEKELIRFVLSSRHGVERLIAHESKMRKQFEDARDSFAELIKLAESPREIEDAIAHFKLASERLRFDKSIYDFHAPTPVSRKDQNGSRTKKAFVLRMQHFFEIRCGRPMTEIITQLMDIVFGGAHSEADGRIARRATTTAARSRLKR